jgi:ketosteroid isomerase-like protein
MKRLILFSAPLALLFVACGDSKKSTEAETSSFSIDSVRTQVNASNAAYGTYFATGDSASFIACYTSDACINPPGNPKICGSNGIGGFFNEGVKMGIKNIVLTTDELMGGKDGVIETGRYDLQGDGGASWDKGKFIVIWKEENGKWKMYRDIWNSDAPSPPAKK